MDAHYPNTELIQTFMLRFTSPSFRQERICFRCAFYCNITRSDKVSAIRITAHHKCCFSTFIAQIDDSHLQENGSLLKSINGCDSRNISQKYAQTTEFVIVQIRN